MEFTQGSNEQYVSLVFEINTGFSPPPSVGSVVRSLMFLRDVPAQTKGRATIWFNYTSDVRWKNGIPADLEECGFVQIGPMDWDDAERSLSGIRTFLDRIGLRYSEQTTSDD